MLNLYQIFEKFLTLFSSSKNRKQDSASSIQDEHIASLFFGIVNKDKDSVDIKCLLPNVDTKNVEEITEIAEKYAQLLVLLNKEQFNKNIYSILESHRITHKENYKTIMLIDSIISFWDVLSNIEYKKYYQKYKSNQPVIRPSEAFKIK